MANLSVGSKSSEESTGDSWWNTGSTFGSKKETPEVGADGWWNKDSAFGNKESTGWFTGGAQAVSGIASAWTGMQQLDLAKKQFDFQKSSYATNLANQAKVTNAGVEDQWLRRAAVGGTDAAASQYGSLANYKASRSVSGS